MTLEMRIFAVRHSREVEKMFLRGKPRVLTKLWPNPTGPVCSPIPGSTDLTQQLAMSANL